MKVRGDDILEGDHLFVALFDGISSFSKDFLKTLTEMGSIHWVGVQTWLRSSHEGKRWWYPRGGSFVCGSFWQNFLLFWGLFKKNYRDGFYTLGRSTNSNQHSANIAHTQPVLSFPALFNLPLCTLCQGKQIKYIWFIISFKCFIAFVVEQPCVRLRGGQCFSPQKIPSWEGKMRRRLGGSAP